KAQVWRQNSIAHFDVLDIWTDSGDVAVALVAHDRGSDGATEIAPHEEKIMLVQWRKLDLDQHLARTWRARLGDFCETQHVGRVSIGWDLEGTHGLFPYNDERMKSGNLLRRNQCPLPRETPAKHVRLL